MENKINKILSPIANNIVFFLISFFLIFLPSIIRDCTDVRYWLTAIPVSIAWAYVLSVLVMLARSIVVKVLLYVILSIVTIIEVYIICLFGTRFSALIIRLILETNIEEASGFISQYISPNLFYIVIYTSLFASLIFFLEKRIRPFALNKINVIYKLIISIFITLTLSLIIVREIREFRLLNNHNNIATIYQTRLEYFYGGLYTSYGLLIDAFNNWLITSKDIDELSSTLKQPVEISTTYESNHICMIIGESYNKHHASIYNYHLNTTPVLLSEVSAGRLFVYNDVITPVNATIEAMQLMSSFSNKDNNLKWSQTPLIPRLFKLSGYHCSFISNSECKLSEESVWDTKNNYWVSEKTAPLMFDAQNMKTYKYDHLLIKELNDIDPLSHDNSFTIIHLLGQHSDYVDRYPVEFSKFSSNDYTDMSLSNTQKEGIAHYDNATYYNDYVVSNILSYYNDADAVIIYFSDHGEEVHDYRNFIGRSHEESLTKERVKYQFEVPFMIWMSELYKKKHPDIVSLVETSLDRSYMIDDLPHLMLDIAGIDCKWYDPSRSVINEKYNDNRKRLLLNTGRCYEDLMKE